jgi:hypothetical protein
LPVFQAFNLSYASSVRVIVFMLHVSTNERIMQYKGLCRDDFGVYRGEKLDIAAARIIFRLFEWNRL